MNPAATTPRLRMFAGPNGSGKSTIKSVIRADKIAMLEKSQQSGYRNYLYFVATDDPLINISRVKHRVKSGGHDVPTEKITTRYYRSLDLLWAAIKRTNRAYIFDNSGSNLLWLAEITEANSLKSRLMPCRCGSSNRSWIKSVNSYLERACIRW